MSDERNILIALGAVAAIAVFMTTRAQLKTSPAGRAAIILHEGMTLEPYLDDAGRWTVGVGHLIIPGDGVPHDANGRPLPIDEIFMMTLFETDLSNAERIIRKYVRVPLTQGQFDALADFVFQFGEGNFALANGGSTLLKMLNSGNYPGAAAEFKRWVYVTNPQTGVKSQNNGLIARRDDNFKVFVA